MSELSEFRKAEVGQLKTIIDDVAKETVKELKTTSPKRKGKYRKGWARKTGYESSVKKRVVIYSKSPEYRKTHLLEKGHAKRNGGRVEGIPHISIAEKRAAESIIGRLKRL